MPELIKKPKIDPRFAVYKLAVKKSKIHRYGLYAAEDIPANRKVIEYTGERLNRKETKARDRGNFTYLFAVDNYWTLDGAVGELVRDFSQCNERLWKDRLGQISLATTTLFWGAGATLRLIVLNWSQFVLGYGPGAAAQLTAVVAVGIAVGAVLAARRVKLEQAVRVLPANRETTVAEVLTPNGAADSAGPGETITVRLADDVDISRGDTIVAAPTTAALARKAAGEGG